MILDPKIVRDRSEDVIEQVEEWSRSSGVAADEHYLPLDEILKPLDSVILMSSFTGNIRGIDDDEELR